MITRRWLGRLDSPIRAIRWRIIVLINRQGRPGIALRTPLQDEPRIANRPFTFRFRRGKIVVQGSTIKPGVSRHKAKVSAMAAPTPLTWALYQSRSDRIQLDIAADLEQIGVPAHPFSVKSTLENVSNAPVFSIGCLGIDAIDMSHDKGKIRLTCADHQMIVIAHQAVSDGAGVVTLHGVANDTKEHPAIALVFENDLPSVTSASDVVSPIFDKRTQLSCQPCGPTLSDK